MYKKSLLLLFLTCSLISYSQEIILSDTILQIYKLREEANEYYFSARHDKSAVLKAIEKYDFLFSFSNVDESVRYLDYADLLAQSGDLYKAMIYYDWAFELKRMTAREFGFSFRKKYFEEDTVLYYQKLDEFNNRMDYYYTAREQELLGDIKAIIAVDQFARQYSRDFPKHKVCSKSIIPYADSLTMVKLIELYEKYPEFDNPLTISKEIGMVLGRHIYTGYPEFWLKYEEARTRKCIIEGKGYPKGYARTYDRCVITSGRELYSVYGEWDNNGKNVNPDKELVNKRRANLGLPPLEEKKDNPNEFFITY